MTALIVALSATAGILGGISGAAICWLVLNHRVEAMAACVVATQLDHGPDRLTKVAAHRAAWRALIRIRPHLPHRRAAA